MTRLFSMVMNVSVGGGEYGWGAVLDAPGRTRGGRRGVRHRIVAVPPEGMATQKAFERQKGGTEETKPRIGFIGVPGTGRHEATTRLVPRRDRELIETYTRKGNSSHDWHRSRPCGAGEILAQPGHERQKLATGGLKGKPGDIQGFFGHNHHVEGNLDN